MAESAIRQEVKKEFDIKSRNQLQSSIKQVEVIIKETVDQVVEL